MHMNYSFIATTTFGLEACAKREALGLGLHNVTAADGKVQFIGDAADMVTANLWFRCADRILLKMGEFQAESFDQLFEGVKKLPWGDILPQDAKFTVTGKSARSKLFSVPDCQRITKKAIVESLKTKYETDWFEETGASYTVQVAMHKDMALLTIDTTGQQGLHKRGYREVSGAAPLKETLASALIQLSFWNKDRILLDPFCGSGTIAIEAAMLARNIAPGLSRRFACEDWDIVEPSLWKQGRKNAYAKIDQDTVLKIYASDIDKSAIEIAKQNAEEAGVSDSIVFSVSDFKDAPLHGDYGVLITNPPYGERMVGMKEAEQMYADLGEKMRNAPTWSSYVITSMEYFEKIFGKKADAKRKLYNGNIKTDYFQFYGPRPPKEDAPIRG